MVGIDSIGIKMEAQDDPSEIILSNTAMVLGAAIEQLRNHAEDEDDDRARERLYGTLYLTEIAYNLLGAGQTKANYEMCELGKRESV